jgi:hypothetical protein
MPAALFCLAIAATACTCWVLQARVCFTIMLFCFVILLMSPDVCAVALCCTSAFAGAQQHTQQQQQQQQHPTWPAGCSVCGLARSNAPHGLERIVLAQQRNNAGPSSLQQQQ